MSRGGGGARPAAAGRPGAARQGRIDLARSGRRVDVVVDGVPYSTFHPERPWSGHAWDALAAVAAWAPRPRPEILLLGAGAGTVLVLLRRLLPAAMLTAVELDERMVALGRERCGLDATGAEVVIGDALEYLARTRRRFDVILDDLFHPVEGGLGRPVADEGAHLRRVAARLAPGGVAATNVTTDEDPPGLQATVAAAHRAVFAHRLKLVPPRGYNAIFAGSAAPLPPRALRAMAEASGADDGLALLAVRVRRA